MTSPLINLIIFFLEQVEKWQWAKWTHK